MVESGPSPWHFEHRRDGQADHPGQSLILATGVHRGFEIYADCQHVQNLVTVKYPRLPRATTSVELFATGIAGLDDILGGGLARNHLYLIEGDPGTGKTTIAMQFLMEGTRRGQKGLYVTLSESKTELLEIAESHGWSLDGIEVFELGSG